MAAHRIAALCFASSPGAAALLGLWLLTPPPSRLGGERHLVLAVDEPTVSRAHPGEVAISWPDPQGLDFARLPFDRVSLLPSAAPFATALSAAGFAREGADGPFVRPRRWNMLEDWSTWRPRLLLRTEGSTGEEVPCSTRTADGGWRCPRGVVVTPDLVARPEGLGGAVHITALPGDAQLLIDLETPAVPPPDGLVGSVMVLDGGTARIALAAEGPPTACASRCALAAAAPATLRVLGPSPSLAVDLSLRGPP